MKMQMSRGLVQGRVVAVAIGATYTRSLSLSLSNQFVCGLVESESKSTARNDGFLWQTKGK